MQLYVRKKDMHIIAEVGFISTFDSCLSMGKYTKQLTTNNKQIVNA